MGDNVYVADFETTTDPEDCRVWAYGLCNLEDIDTVIVDNSLDSFIDVISDDDSITYFHNLRFDGSFILDWLFRNHFVHVNRNARAGEFTTLISKMGQYYSITVRWRNGVRTEFRDSLKKLPMTVAEIAGAFNLDMTKGEIDYNEFRPIGHTITDVERDYIERDVRIVAYAVKQQRIAGMTRLTVGSDSLKDYQSLISKRSFGRLFPILPTNIDTELRSAYRGGWAYADVRRQGRVQGAGYVYDVNSLYPSVMSADVLPYGEPVFTAGKPTVSKQFPLFITSVTFTAKLKPGHLPCIQIKNNIHFLATEYLERIDEPETVSCTNIDLELWSRHYDLDILSYNGSWLFRGGVGMFDDYITKWNEVKTTSTGGMRTIAKLHLNSLYGKFATNPDVTPKIPIFENDRVKLKLGDPDEREPVYTAMGVFITSYARRKTINAAQSHYDTFAYADTDSLHLIRESEPEDLDIDPVRIGAWKREYRFERAIYVRAKAYCEELSDGTRETHVAGMPRSIAAMVGVDDFVDGATFGGKLVPKHVPGGVVLCEVDFTLNL